MKMESYEFGVFTKSKSVNQKSYLNGIVHSIKCSSLRDTTDCFLLCFQTVLILGAVFATLQVVKQNDIRMLVVKEE